MFSSEWIAPNDLRGNMHITFKKRFSVTDFETALIRITADDFYKLYVNGAYVGEGPAPSYPFRYRFNEYYIGDYLKEGANTVEVQVYYQGLKNRVWVSGDGKAGMIADIFVDGKYRLGTDGSWEYAVDNTFVGGEKLGYDTAYTENRDFTVHPDREKKVKATEPDYAFDSEAFPSVSVENISVEPSMNGNVYLYDFGREYVGTPIVKAYSETDGGEVVLHYAEETDENGNPRFDMRCGCRYEEKCRLRKGENLIRQYDYKGFRYMEIIAGSGVTVCDAAVAVRHFPFPKNAQEIITENENLKAVFKLCSDTLHYGIQESLIDCPTREKAQYLGDAYISGFAHFYLTGDSRLLKKALYDFADSVRFSGKFLSVAPCSYEQRIADYELLYPDFLLKYYTLTGDGETLAELAPVCDAILDEYARYENESGLLENVDAAWNLVDWPGNMRDGYEYNPDGEGELGLHCVLNAYYIFATVSVQRIHAVLNKDCADKAAGLIEAFNGAFFNRETGLYTDCKDGSHSSLHSNMLPVAFGFCTAETVINFLLEKGMKCSVYTAYFYLRALCLSGLENEALELIASEGENSWMNMIKEGATATFEAWGRDAKRNTSLFHPWATAPILILNEYFKDMLR